jgi:Mlc titration factor MtfA (ptsG expression regulator)
MKVIYKLDKLFIRIYSSLILVAGAAFSIAAGLKRPLRRYRATARPFPGEWKEILNDYSPFYRNLDKEGKERFETDIRIFLSDFSVEGIRRHKLDMKTKLLVASGFATLLNGRPDWEPPIKDGVLVYPGTTFNRDYVIGRGMRAGQAAVNSPMIVTQKSLEDSFAVPGDGHNVVFHELAHYFDMEDGMAEGIPSTRMPESKLDRWKQLIHDEWQKASQGRSFLQPYAGTNEAETFAVAVEVFFETPQVMYANNPELYTALKDFFNIDALKILKLPGHL